MQAKTPLSMIKDNYPEDYEGLLSVESNIDFYLDFKSIKSMNITMNASDFRYFDFKVVEYIERILSKWQKN